MMKNLFYIWMMGLILTSCSGEDDAGENIQDPDDSTSSQNVTLEINQVSTPISPYDPGNNTVFFQMLGNKFIYANASNTNSPQFMLSYNLETNSFSNLTTHESICLCGYSSKLVSDQSNLYYIANEAWKYSLENDTWSELNYPSSASNNNGETGVLYKDGKIYFLGGRLPTNRFKYYDTATNGWFNSNDYLYAVETPDLASVGNRIYALGGDPDGIKFSYFTENAGWTALSDLPFEASNNYMTHTVVSFGNRYLFALSQDQIYVYDTQEEVWQQPSIPIQITGNDFNLFSDNLNLYIASRSTDNQFSLYKINVVE